jgi:HAD superfamily hydrolase (TIGR01459 family)
MSVIRTIAGISTIADAYDAFLIDQFGVLRDGRGPYPGAVETLVRLKEAGRRVIILSNSCRRSAENERRLAELGFEPRSWNWFLTSGEVAWQMLKREAAGRAPRKCLLISRDGDLSPVNGLDLMRTESGEEADIVLLAGSEGDVYPLSHYERLLAPAARRGVPCLCTNPDKVMLTMSGRAFGAGRIAELYEALGGKVRWIGKPFAAIYDFALDFLGLPDPSRVCAIGDSVEHDIVGAAAAGLGSVLVTTGILEHRSDGERRQLFLEHGAAPDFILPKFLW